MFHDGCLMHISLSNEVLGLGIVLERCDITFSGIVDSSKQTLPLDLLRVSLFRYVYCIAQYSIVV